MSESTSREVGLPNNGAAAESAAAAGKVFQEIMGDFQLTPAIASDGPAMTAGVKDTAKEGSEKLESKPEPKEVAEKAKPPLTRFEAHVLRGLSRALTDGDKDSAEELLGMLAEHHKDHPESVKRVMEELKYIKETSDDPQNLRISWEQGDDRNNQHFVRLYMSKPDSPSSHVEVVIGSDGRNQAVRHNAKTGQSEIIPLRTGMEAVRPVESMRQLSVKKELLRQATERRPPQE